MINREQIQGNWQQLKGSIRKRWGKLTDDDLLECEGNFENIIGKLTERYGISKEKAKEKWGKFLNRVDATNYEIKSIANNISDIAENLSDTALEFTENYKDMIKEKPFTAIGVATLSGIAIGMLISRT